MDDTPSGLISTPSLDLGPIIQYIIDFIVSHFPFFFNGLKAFIGFIVGISIPISLLLFVGIIITVERLKLIRKKEDAYYSAAKVEMAYADTAKVDSNVARKWERVQGLVESTNENDWRQAILEADIMLGDLLTRLGYEGDGIGEQLRRAEKGDFKTLDEAGTAHGIRNRLAHDGAEYSFSQLDARQAISLYRKVFEEFHYI